ncbi:hypothetical protein SSX86_026868 [Deinandra increscens subsp. villosa]|uniref:Peptidase A1 domain-containing protein n=1 Tax=Deinandra increscens subsp. villosa TaxID=3103831 RepID=A0AAP0GMK6_9ASTR
MAPSVFFLFLFISPSFSAFVAPVTKHHVHKTPFYTLKVQLKTPTEPTHLLLHAAATFTAVNRNSSLCHPKCDIAGGNCVISRHRSFARVDSLALPTTDGRNPGQLSTVPKFVFTCSDESAKLLKGHAKKVVTGLAGLGFSNYSLPAQVTTNSSVFALCLSGSPSAPGVAFFGLPGPYYFLPGIDISDHLYYTPIFFNTDRLEDGYFIGVKSIKVNRKMIITTPKLLTVDENGNGGTRISTINPYTILERSIFKSLIEAFRNESAIMKLKSVKPIRPFHLCYEADGLSETHLGPNVPSIDLVMQNDVIWRILGKNSMVRIVDEGLDVWCLAIVDGGRHGGSSMVIGGHQLEDNLLQFDLGRKTLGFSSTLLQYKTMCANFNFSTNNAISAF